MENTPKIVTIIGLVFEFLGLSGLYVGGWVLANFDQFPGVSAESMDIPQAEFNEMMEIFSIFGSVLYVMGVVITIIVLINAYLFIKLMKGNYNEQQAKKVYLYQAIWGGLNLLFNQLTGILYLVSGVTGYNGHKEEKNIREGI
jgi:hypothetical protein